MRAIVIAEGGNCHEGDIGAAYELIKQAKKAGADYIKFQAGTAEGFAREPSDIEKYRRYALKPHQYRSLIRKGRDVGIHVFFSVFGKDRWLDEFRFPNLPLFKIAGRQCSSDYIWEYDSPGTFISIPSNIAPISAPIRYGVPLHVVLQYPAEEPMLSRIDELRNHFHRPVGYSDHTLGIRNCIDAVERHGAVVIEKHFTLSHDFGPLRDHKHAAIPVELGEMVKQVKEIELKCLVTSC